MENKTKAEWLESRKGRVTASRAAAICGYDDFTSPLAVWAEMTGRAEPFTGNIATRAGQLLEPLVAETYAANNGIEISELRPYGTELVISKSNSRFAATPDYLVKNKTLLECKTSKIENMSRWSEHPPKHYLFQVQWQLFCTELSEAHIACMFGADPERYSQYLINADSEFQNLMQEIAGRFLECLDTDTPPTWGISGNDKSILSKIFPKTSEIKCATAEEVEQFLPALAQYVAIKGEEKTLNAALKKLKTCRDKTENELRLWLAGAGAAQIGNYNIQNKTISKNGYTVAASSYDSMTIKHGE